MSEAREEILRRINKGLNKTLQPAATKINTAATAEPMMPNAYDNNELVAQFQESVLRSAASLTQIADLQTLPQQVEEYLKTNNLTSPIRLCGNVFNELAWNTIAVNKGRCVPEDRISLVQACAGIAETGTVVSFSTVAQSTLGLFLPAICLVYLRKADIVATMEAVWERFRQSHSHMPRTINLITGPSRTGDIEQQILIGAHGPGQLHVFLGD